MRRVARPDPGGPASERSWETLRRSRTRASLPSARPNSRGPGPTIATTHIMSTAMDTAAKTLGTTTSDLMTQLQSGKSLASIASSTGVSQTDLVKDISTALQSADSKLSSDQATKLATNLVNGTQQNNQQQAWSTGNTDASSTYSVIA